VALKKVLETVIVVIAIIIVVVVVADVMYALQFPISARREIRILQTLKHENLVNLLEVSRTKGLCILYS
jgi:serine/threonine protein kinase